MATMTHSVRRVSEHFEPEPALDPSEQRKLRGHLEQIDYAAYAANREVAQQTLPRTDLASFQRFAVATAHARSKWVAAAVAMAEASPTLSAQQTAQLQALRSAYEELSEAYDAMRRMVERGYVSYQPKS